MSARWAWVCLALVASAQAAFVQDGTMMQGLPLAGWSQPGSYGLPDAVGDESHHRDLVRFWLAWLTQQGGEAAPSPDNPLTGFAIRIDHAGAAAATEIWNLQINLGHAGPGQVDHLLQVRPTGDDAAQVQLNQYDWPAATDPFTTNRLTVVFSNDPERAEYLPGVQVRTGTWASGKHAVEVLLPISWLEQAPASRVAADGSGVSVLWGTVFGSTGTWGAVGTPKDILDDDGRSVVNTDASTGRTTAQPAAAMQLAFLDEPGDVTAGDPIEDLRVEVLDIQGRRVETATHEVHVMIGDDPTGSAALAGTLRAQAIDGVATFSGLSIDTPGTGYTFDVVAANLVAATSTPFDVLAPPAVAIDASPVDATGQAQAQRWGAWSAEAGAAGVASANYLKVTNTGPVDDTTFTLSFSAPSLVGVSDAAWSIPLQDNIRFACAETLSGQPPSQLSFTMGPVSPSASTTCTFSPSSADGAGVIYVRYELLLLPPVLAAQDYAAPFTVEVS